VPPIPGGIYIQLIYMLYLLQFLRFELPEYNISLRFRGRVKERLTN